MTEYIHGTSSDEQGRLAKLNQLLNERCLNKIDLGGAEKVLDIGCGLGIFTRQVAGKLSNGIAVGIEKEKAQIDRGRLISGVSVETDMADIRQGSAYNLLLPEEEMRSFDLVFIRFLLEHLQDPNRAMEQAYEALRYGGKIMLVDDDHANFRITPEQPAFDRLWKAYCRIYEALGNDPYIGRNLTTLLKKAGFKELKIDFILFGATADESDFLDYANNLIGILEGAKEEIMAIYPNEENFEKDMQSLRAWSRLPDATLWYAANWAEGVK